MPSTRAINYPVRANKHVERQMLMELLQRLDRLPPRLASYRYVGFGGIYFTDFVQAHRYLGVDHMVSIEHNTPRERFAFNKPLACIDLRFGGADEHLPQLLAELREADAPGMFWLDYDGKMDADVLADIATLASGATPLTFAAVTVNCQPEPRGQRMEAFARRFGEKAPPDVTAEAQLGGWSLAKVCHRLIAGEIAAALRDRNAALPEAERLHYTQLVRIHYADGAQMLTAGGILHTAGQAQQIADAMGGLLQVRTAGEEPLLVDAPVLTAREIRHMSAQLPGALGSAPSSPGVLQADAERFARLYRHYPLYAQVEVL
jgi:hypothetical protein